MTGSTPPTGLKRRGRALWRDLMERLEFDSQEAAIALELCRTLDRIDALEACIEADGVMIVGSTGQAVLHPAIAEQRQQQQSAGRLVTMLNIPATASGAAMSRVISSQASAAANARWGRSKGARGA